MAAPRRIELMPATPAGQTSSKDSRPATVRFNLSLAETTEKTCPEFSYTELVKNALPPKEDSLDPDDPFAAQDKADHDKLLNIAASFEAKYGKPAKPKKKKVDRKFQDLVDLGEGYDEDDPFIDNTEAYDEIVPASLTTQHGGFYINSGQLDFRVLSDDSNDAFQVIKKKKKKRVIGSDDESELGEDGKKKRGRKKKKLLDGEFTKNGKKKLKRKFSSESDKTPKKFKLKDGKRGRPPKIKKTSPTVAELLSQTPSTSTTNGVAGLSPKAKVTDGATPTQSSTNLSKLDSTIDAVISQVVRSASPDSGSRSPRPEGQTLSPENAPKLPESMPKALMEAITRIKNAAKESAEGKCKFFTPNVNDILLRIENICRQLTPALRSTVYNHLAAYLPCGKETLIKRAKKLRLNQQDNKLKEPINKLKEAILSRMPAFLAKHQNDLIATQQLKEKMQAEGGKVDQGKEQKEGASTESDEETEKTEGGEKQKRIMAPRKKFEWDSEIRGYLCDIVRIKLEVFELSKIRSQSAEEYLKAFLDAEIKPLWPQGWIQTRMLFKESRAVHGRLTVAQPKQRKIFLPTSGTGSKPSTPSMTPPVTPSHSGTAFTSPPGTGPSSLAATPSSSTTTARKDDAKLSSSVGASPALQQAKHSAEEYAAPNLLDYAGMSYLSSAKSRVGEADSSSVTEAPKPSLSMGTVMDTPATQALKNFSASVLTEKTTPPKQSISPTNFMDKFKEFTDKNVKKINVKETVGSVSRGFETVAKETFGGVIRSELDAFTGQSKQSSAAAGQSKQSSAAAYSSASAKSLSGSVVDLTLPQKVSQPKSTTSSSTSGSSMVLGTLGKSGSSGEKYKSLSLTANLLTASDLSDVYRNPNQLPTGASYPGKEPAQGGKVSGSKVPEPGPGVVGKSSGMKVPQSYTRAPVSKETSGKVHSGLSLLGVQQAVVGSSSDIKHNSTSALPLSLSAAGSHPKAPQSKATSLLKGATSQFKTAEGKKTVMQRPAMSWVGAAAQPSNSITSPQLHPGLVATSSGGVVRQGTAAEQGSHVITQHSYSKPAALSPSKTSALSQAVSALGQVVRKAEESRQPSRPTATVSHVQQTQRVQKPLTSPQQQQQRVLHGTPGNSPQTLGVSQRRSETVKPPASPQSAPSLSNKSYHGSSFQTSPQSPAHPRSRASPTSSPSQTYAGLSISQIQQQMVAQSRNLGYSQQAHVSRVVTQASPSADGKTIWRTADLGGGQKGQSAFAVPKATIASGQHHSSSSGYAGLSLSDLKGHPLHSAIPQSPDRLPSGSAMFGSSTSPLGTTPLSQGSYAPLYTGSVHSPAGGATGHPLSSPLNYGLPYTDTKKPNQHY